MALTLSEWADKLCMPYYVLYNRIMIYKWTIKRAIETPYKEKLK